MRWQVQINCC